MFNSNRNYIFNDPLQFFLESYLLFDYNNLFAQLYGIKYFYLTNNLYTIIWFKVTIPI